MYEQFLDDLASGLDEGTISRRRALKLVAGAVLGTALLPIAPKQAQALTRKQRRRCRRKGGVPVSNGNCHCTRGCGSDITRFACKSTANCACYRTYSGKGFCGQRGTAFGAGCLGDSDCLSPAICVFPDGVCPLRGCARDLDCPETGYRCINGACVRTTCVSPCP